MMKDNVDIIRKSISRLLLICSVVELLIFPALENLYGCFTSIYAWGLCSVFVLKRTNLEKNLLPTLVVFGYIFCYYILPIPVTLIEGKPLTFNFEVPFLMFSNQLLNVSTIVFSYIACLKIYRSNNFLLRTWDKMGYFRPPTETQVWIVGAIGIVSLIFSVLTQNIESDRNIEASGNIMAQLMNYMKPLSAFPVCMFFARYYGYSKEIKHKKLIIIYIAIVVILGIATTRRFLVFSIIATLVLVYLLAVVLENRKFISAKKSVIIILGLFLLTGPLADLAIAMILNRKMVDGAATFDRVMELYNDKETLYKLRRLAILSTDNGGRNSEGWSEYYVDNVFLDRFCNIRVQDATLTYAEKLGYNHPKMHEYFRTQLTNLLPSFITENFGLEKKVIYTATDLLVSIRFKDDRLNFGWRVGGDTGIGLALLGYWYYPFAFFIYFFCFYFMSSCVFSKRGLLIIPIPILSSLISYMMYFDNGYGIFKSISFLLRNGWQSIIFYSVIMLIVRLFTPKQRHIR